MSSCLPLKDPVTVIWGYVVNSLKRQSYNDTLLSTNHHQPRPTTIPILVVEWGYSGGLVGIMQNAQVMQAPPSELRHHPVSAQSSLAKSSGAPVLLQEIRSASHVEPDRRQAS